MAEIRGLEEFLRTIKKLPEGVAQKGAGPFDSALKKGATVWRDAAKQKVSGLGPGNKSARRINNATRLKNEIGVRKDNDPQSNGFTHRYTVSYGKAFWGQWVELGSEKFSDNRDYPKTPFLRPAFDENERKILDVISDELEAQIKRLVKKAKA